MAMGVKLGAADDLGASSAAPLCRVSQEGIRGFAFIPAHRRESLRDRDGH